MDRAPPRHRRQERPPHPQVLKRYPTATDRGSPNAPPPPVPLPQRAEVHTPLRRVVSAADGKDVPTATKGREIWPEIEAELTWKSGPQGRGSRRARGLRRWQGAAGVRRRCSLARGPGKAGATPGQSYRAAPTRVVPGEPGGQRWASDQPGRDRRDGRAGAPAAPGRH